ncbi:hypothetical protein [Streptomyces sp. RTd22]|uniref:hypothetical protein n=1 Tax=Streptomyces sp. RTd22 TaxID=1841249 RepID=UPI0007C560F2|nr:hypothetical protein [Streptomyces sp. RTd22]
MAIATIRFDSPAPPVPRLPRSRAAFAAALRERSGEWALLGQHHTAGCARQDAYEIRRALRPANAAFGPAGEFEAEARTLGGEYRVYVRHVGGERP